MMRRNHVFFCPSALSPGFRNWVEMTRNMQQEGVGLVLLPRPASLVRSPVLPCVRVCVPREGVRITLHSKENGLVAEPNHQPEHWPEVRRTCSTLCRGWPR